MMGSFLGYIDGGLFDDGLDRNKKLLFLLNYL